MRAFYDLNDMMLFLNVVDAGSFTAAADLLNMPKANLSRKIARLETQLGLVLLERTTRSQHLTESGRKFLEHCRRIHDEIDLANSSTFETLNKVEGKLRVGASVGIGQEILRPEISAFMLKYPELQVELVLGNQRVDMVAEGFDLLIRIGKLEDSNLIAKRLGVIQRSFFAGPQYLASKPKVRSVKDLANLDLIMMSSAHKEGRIVLHSGEKKDIIKKEPKLFVDDFSLVKQAIIDGVGTGVLPSYMCEQELKSNVLINILPKWKMAPLGVHALYPKHRVNIPKVAAFLDFISNIFAKRLG